MAAPGPKRRTFTQWLASLIRRFVNWLDPQGATVVPGRPETQVPQAPQGEIPPIEEPGTGPKVAPGQSIGLDAPAPGGLDVDGVPVEDAGFIPPPPPAPIEEDPDLVRVRISIKTSGLSEDIPPGSDAEINIKDQILALERTLKQQDALTLREFESLDKETQQILGLEDILKQKSKLTKDELKKQVDAQRSKIMTIAPKDDPKQKDGKIDKLQQKASGLREIQARIDSAPVLLETLSQRKPSNNPLANKAAENRLTAAKATLAGLRRDLEAANLPAVNSEIEQLTRDLVSQRTTELMLTVIHRTLIGKKAKVLNRNVEQAKAITTFAAVEISELLNIHPLNDDELAILSNFITPSDQRIDNEAYFRDPKAIFQRKFGVDSLKKAPWLDSVMLCAIASGYVVHNNEDEKFNASNMEQILKDATINPAQEGQFIALVSRVQGKPVSNADAKPFIDNLKKHMAQYKAPPAERPGAQQPGQDQPQVTQAPAGLRAVNQKEKPPVVLSELQQRLQKRFDKTEGNAPGVVNVEKPPGNVPGVLKTPRPPIGPKPFSAVLHAHNKEVAKATQTGKANEILSQLGAGIQAVKGTVSGKDKDLVEQLEKAVRYLRTDDQTHDLQKQDLAFAVFTDAKNKLGKGSPLNAICDAAISSLTASHMKPAEVKHFAEFVNTKAKDSAPPRVPPSSPKNK